MVLRIDENSAWRYNKSLLDKYKKIGTKEQKHLISEFEDTLNQYAEQSLDWDVTVSNIRQNTDRSSMAEAQREIDHFNKVRSARHNKLIDMTCELDELFIKNHQERFCNFDTELTKEDLKDSMMRSNITDAAFSYYAQTHPNDRLDDKTVQWVRDVDFKLMNHGGVNFKTDINEMQTRFNNIDIDYKEFTYKEHNFFLNTSHDKSNFKVYSPMEVATALKEENIYDTVTPYEQSVIVSTLIYSDMKNQITTLSNKNIDKYYDANINNMINSFDNIQPDVLNNAGTLITKYQRSQNNIDRYITSSFDIQPHIDKAIQHEFTEGLNELNTQYHLTEKGRKSPYFSGGI